MKINHRIAGVSALALSLALLFSGCSSGGTNNAADSGSKKSGSVTIENCGQKVEYKTPVTSLMANDGNIISISLAAGAKKQLTAVTGTKRDFNLLSLKYGDTFKKLNSVNDEYMNLENVIAADPQVVFAGWGYGFNEEQGLTPEALKERGIDTYVLSESCRAADGQRGTMDPWKALDTDIRNIGKITGNEKTANKTADDIAARVKKLRELPKPKKKPVGIIFDNATETIYSCGNMGAPQAMMDVAGVQNALADTNDTWTKISWERLAAADPDVIFFVDYPRQSFEEKIAALESNPASKNLRAVKEKRILNLPYGMWTSGPMTVEGAEYIRKAMEHWDLAPKTKLSPDIDIRKLSLPGNEWLK